MSSRLKTASWGALCVLALSATAAPKSSKPTPSPPPARVDLQWERQVLRAVASGPPDFRAVHSAQARLGAERTAREDATRRLLESSKALRLDATHTVAEATRTPEATAELEAAVRTFRIVEERYFSDDGVELDAELSLAAIEAAVPEDDEGAAEEAPDRHGKASALIVDARGLSVTPALRPRLLGGDGEVLHGPSQLTEEARKSTLAMSYFRTPEAVKKSGKLGAKPLTVKALKVQGPDLVLGPDAVKKLAELSSTVLKEGRVFILCNVH